MNIDLKNRIQKFLKTQDWGYIRNEDDGEYDAIDFDNIANLDMFLEEAKDLLREVIEENQTQETTHGN